MTDERRNGRASRLGSQDDTPSVFNDTGTRDVDQPRPAPRLGEADELRPDVLPAPAPLHVREGQADEAGVDDHADGALVHHPTVDDESLHLRPVRRDLGAGNGQLAVQRAPSLPLDSLSGPPQSVVKRHSAAILAVAFQAINSAKEVMEQPENQAAQVAASKVAFEMTMKALEMAYGKKVDVGFAVKSQEDLPRWEDVPAEVRAALDKLYDDHNTENSG